MRKFRIALFLVLTFGLSLAVFGQTPGASATWQVQKYDLDVRLPEDNGRAITVTATLSMKNVSAQPATRLTLRIAPAAEVISVKINGSAVEPAKNEEKINAGTSLQRIAVSVPAVAPNAVLTAVVEYKLTVKENSALSVVSTVNSQFLPLSYWYPTPNSWFFTRGADNAAVRIKVSASNGQTIVSSGVESSGAFEQKLNSQPFFIAGGWDVIASNGISVFVPKGVGGESQKRAAELAGLMAEARTFVEVILGKAPDAPLRIVASRRAAGFGSGGTVVVDEAVFRRSKVDSLTALNLAEAMARMWLGGAVSVNGDGYGVITEGLSRYIATQFIESKYGKDVADIERLRQRNAYAAVSKRDAPMNLVSPLDDYYYPEVANKGAMVWRILAKRVGAAEFANTLRSNMQDGNLNIAELRAAFSSQKELVDYLFDQVTDMDLLIGLPQVVGAETRVALRNSGGADATVDVAATTASGENISSSTTLRARSYGEIAFRSNAKIVRVEIDPDKLYPQINYADDIKPQVVTESDGLLAAKRLFDKPDFAGAETTARSILRDLPRYDDVRILLGRSLLAQGKTSEAEREFQAVLAEKLPTARSLAWANVGLADVANRANQNDAASRFAMAAINADAEYGASLAARNLRTKLGLPPASIDVGVKAFFADFDKAATSNRKADLDALIMPGEVTRFAAGISGSTEQWQTQIRAVDTVDANNVLVEANMSIKLLNKESQTGTAVYRLTKVGNAWKLGGVEMFEVR